jgi:hypothetical protein
MSTTATGNGHWNGQEVPKFDAETLELLRARFGSMGVGEPWETPQEAEKPKEPEQRDAAGRYAKGNKGGVGNPFARNVAMIRKCFFSAVTENEMTCLVRLIFHMAMEGDLKAAGVLFKYMIGQPNQYQNPDALDTDEWQRRRESYMWSPEEMQRMLKCMPLDMILQFLGIALPAILQKEKDDWVASMKADKEKARRKEERKRAKGKDEGGRMKDETKTSVLSESELGSWNQGLQAVSLLGEHRDQGGSGDRPSCYQEAQNSVKPPSPDGKNLSGDIRDGGGRQGENPACSG